MLLVRVAVVSMAVLAVAASPATAGYRLSQAVHSNATPAGYQVGPRLAIATANRSDVVRSELRHGPLKPRAFLLRGTRQWQISYFRGSKEVARATIDGSHARVAGRVWTGPFVLWPTARGTKSAFRDRLTVAALVLCVLFVVPFVDPRRMFTMLHLDLLAFTILAASLLLFTHGHLYTSVPLQYPPLLYLLGRLLWIGSGRGSPPGKAGPLGRERVLLAGVVVLLIGRVACTVAWGEVSDIGYASVFGADSLHHGWALYTVNPAHLDTYGPVTYFLYLPFEVLFPLSSGWTGGAGVAAHTGAITLDLVVVALLIVLGRRLRPDSGGRLLGITLAYAWLACPFTFLVLVVAANDAIVAVFILLALLMLDSPIARGAVLGLGAAAKFSPLGLVPLFAVGPERSLRGVARCGAAAGLVFALVFAPYVHQSGFRAVWDSTLGFQLDRTSPFTLWGLHPALEWIKPLFSVLAVAIAIGVMFVPRERTPVRIAALSGAVILALQLAGNYWAHTYVTWFAAPAFIALLCGLPSADPVRARPSAERTPVAVTGLLQ